MKIFFEILKTILPPGITAICTFLITKYSHNKNVPLDKMEVAYTKIYQPIYRMVFGRKFKDIKNKTNNINRLISEISIILSKNNEYADRSTINTFRSFLKYKNKETFDIFVRNISNEYLFIRRKLGYLEPNIFPDFKYLLKTEKAFIRIMLELVVLYIFIVLYSWTNPSYEASFKELSSKGKIQSLFLVVTIFVMFIIVLEAVVILLKKVLQVIIIIFKIFIKKIRNVWKSNIIFLKCNNNIFLKYKSKLILIKMRLEFFLQKIKK